MLRKDRTGSSPLNRAMNWVKLTLGDATVAVCRIAGLHRPPRLGSGCLERSGLSSLGSGSDCGGDLASAPVLRPRQPGWLAMCEVAGQQVATT